MNIFVLNDAIIYMGDIWYIPVLSIGYTIVSLAYTKWTGLVIYDFLSYEDWKSYAVLAAGFLGSLILHIIISLLTQVTKGRYEWDIQLSNLETKV